MDEDLYHICVSAIFPQVVHNAEVAQPVRRGCRLSNNAEYRAQKVGSLCSKVCKAQDRVTINNGGQVAD